MGVAQIQNISGNIHNRYLLPHPMAKNMGLPSLTSAPAGFNPDDGHWHWDNKHVIVHDVNNTRVYHFDPFTDTFSLGVSYAAGSVNGDLNRAGDRLVLFKSGIITVLNFDNETGVLSFDCSITNTLLNQRDGIVNEVRWSPDGDYIVAACSHRDTGSHTHVLKYDRVLKSLTIVATHTIPHAASERVTDWSINNIIVTSGLQSGLRVFSFDKTTNILTNIQTISGTWRHVASKWDMTGKFLVCTNSTATRVGVFKWTTILTYVASITLPSSPGVTFNASPEGKVSWDKTSRFIFTSCRSSSSNGAGILEFNPLTNAIKLWKTTRVSNPISKFIMNPFNNRLVMLRETSTNPLELYSWASDIIY